MKQEDSIISNPKKAAEPTPLKKKRHVTRLVLAVVVGGLIGATAMSIYKGFHPLELLGEDRRLLVYGYAMKHCLENHYTPKACADIELSLETKMFYFPQDGNYYGDWGYDYQVSATDGATHYFTVDVSPRDVKIKPSGRSDPVRQVD